MVGSNGTMIAIRLVRSKLRKREEHSNSVHPADVVLQTAAPAPVATTQPVVHQAFQADLTYQGQFLWPPPPQPYMYNNDQVNRLHPSASKNYLCRVGKYSEKAVLSKPCRVAKKALFPLARGTSFKFRIQRSRVGY